MHAQPKQPTLIGVLGDMNGPYADFAGPGAVIAAGLAAEEVNAGTKFPSVEILSADHQNKPDLAVSIARSWIDIQGYPQSWNAQPQAQRSPCNR